MTASSGLAPFIAAVPRQVVRAGLISEDDGPPEWREHMRWWYRWSSFAYCLAGGLLLRRPARPDVPARAALLRRLPVPLHGRADLFERSPVAIWPTRTPFNYLRFRMAAGRLYVATFNTILQFVLSTARGLGPMSFPRDMVAVFTTSILDSWGSDLQAPRLAAAFKR